MFTRFMIFRINLLLVISIFGLVNAQNNHVCYNFTKGEPVAVSQTVGFYSAGENIFSNSEEIVDKITVLDNGFITVKKAGATEKFTNEELCAKYWGFHNKETIYRFDPKYADKGVAVKMVVIGTLCLYANFDTFYLTYPKKDENGFLHYAYNFTEASDVIRISVGLQGEIVKLSNKNFADILGQFDEGLQTSYLEELDLLKRKMDDPVTDQWNMDLFSKYFEKINNDDYKK